MNQNYYCSLEPIHNGLLMYFLFLTTHVLLLLYSLYHLKICIVFASASWYGAKPPSTGVRA